MSGRSVGSFHPVAPGLPRQGSKPKEQLWIKCNIPSPKDFEGLVVGHRGCRLPNLPVTGVFFFFFSCEAQFHPPIYLCRKTPFPPFGTPYREVHRSSSTVGSHLTMRSPFTDYLSFLCFQVVNPPILVQVVVMHDETLSRTMRTESKLPVNKMHLNEVCSALETFTSLV